MKKPEELIEVEKLEKQGKLKQAVQEWQDKENKLSLLEDQYFSELRKMRESGKLGEQYRNLSDKRADIGSKRRLYAEKLHWARMTPEQRKREIESNERVNKRLEDERKAVEAFEKTLTKEQLELRKKVIGILRPLAPVIVGCTLPEIKAEDMEEVFKAERAEYEEEWKRFASLLKEVGDDPEKIRAVLCKQDALTLGNMPQLFDSEYAEHRTGKQLTEADHFASFAYMYGHVNKKKFDEEEFIGLLKNYKNAQNVDNDCKCKFAKKLSAMFPKFTDHQIENLTRCYECQNHETYTQLIVGKDDYYCKECGFSIKIDMRKDYEIALDGTTNARRRLEQFEMQTQPPSRKEAENLRKKYGKEIWWDEDTVERFINKGGG